MSAARLAEPSTQADGPADADPRASGRRWGTGWLALAVAVGLLLGFAAGLLAPTLARPGDDSPEAGFARDMSTHHAQAVEMSVLAQQRAGDPRVRSLAVDIMLTQQAQIGMMQSWLREWKLDPNGTQPRMAWMEHGEHMVEGGLMPGMATDAERERLRNAAGQEFDVLFLELMIKHHNGGIEMAQGVLDLSDHPEVRRLAQAMVDGQEKENAVMQKLLTELRP
ncbi:MAG TPA: DUF305 domain-containing protein [Micromonosporaceae bacterium]